MIKHLLFELAIVVGLAVLALYVIESIVTAIFNLAGKSLRFSLGLGESASRVVESGGVELLVRAEGIKSKQKRSRTRRLVEALDTGGVSLFLKPEATGIAAAPGHPIGADR